MKVEEVKGCSPSFMREHYRKQEEALRNYFRTTEVPEHLQKDKEIFLALTRVQISGGSSCGLGG